AVEIATFTHANGIEPATDFTPTVDWGIDGHHADAAAITQAGDGTYHVSAVRPVFSAPGTYTISVGISEDNVFTLVAASQLVNSPTATTVSSSTNPSVFGQTLTFTATVTPTSGSGTPDGIVTFMDGAATVGSVSLSAGQATFITSSLATGMHTIVAS